MKIVIADSSTLIALLDTDNFSLLFKLFEKIIITDTVYSEITYKYNHEQTIKHYISKNSLQIESIKEDELFEMLIKRLDIGESKSILLAKTLELPLIIDERKGRAIAKELGIKIIGLIGIILKLIDKKIISKNQAISIIQELEENNFRISEELKRLVYGW